MRLVAAATTLLVYFSAPAMVMSAADDRLAAVAVFPIENLTNELIPDTAVRQFLVQTLSAEGVTVLDDEVLEAFMARHRVRYAAGIDSITAALLREETGVEGVVIASVELSSPVVPPKIALFVRIVSTADTPAVVWAEDAGLSGDDAPGLFDLGLINHYEVLLDRAFGGIRTSLVAYLRTGERRTGRTPASKFRPQSAYRGFTHEPGPASSVAVVPFFNLSERRRAGEIMALLFMRHLSTLREFRVLDIGVTRNQLLSARIIMDGGLSVTDADTIADLIDADFVLAGRVIRYEDYEGPGGLNGVEFSTVLIERETRKVVWSSHSYNKGTDGVRFFGRGQSRTAHVMATQMVGLTAEAIAGHGR